MDDWPFGDSKKVAAITVRQIIKDGQPILYVIHDSEDGGWQFLTGGEVTTEDALVVSLGEIYEFDPSIGELADLPLGWTAERGVVGEPWKRFES